MSRWLLMVLLVSSTAVGCGDEEDPPKAGPGEPCETDSDCENDVCQVVSTDGSKACDGGTIEGGW